MRRHHSSPQQHSGNPHPNCPILRSPDVACGIMPDKADHDQRTFECPERKHSTTEVVDYSSAFVVGGRRCGLTVAFYLVCRVGATAGRASARWPPSTTRGLVSPPVRIPLLFGDNVPLETMACHLKRRAFHTVPGIERGTAVSKGLGFTTAPMGHRRVMVGRSRSATLQYLLVRFQRTEFRGCPGFVILVSLLIL